MAAPDPAAAATASDLFSPPPALTLTTPRLHLTTLQLSDLSDLEPIWRSPEVMRWTTTGPLTSREQAETWLFVRAVGPKVIQFAVRLRTPSPSPSSSSPSPSSPSPSPSSSSSSSSSSTPAAGPCIGIVGSFKRPKLGYLFHPAYHGRGYATEAVRAFVAAYFDRVPSPSRLAGDGGIRYDPSAYDYLEAWTDAENWGSQRVLGKCGFRRGRTFVDEFMSPVMGLRSSVVWHVARPGMTLEEVGVGEDGGMRGEKGIFRSGV